MNVVVIQLRATAGVAAYHGGRPRAVGEFERPARLDTLQHADEPLFHAMLGGNFPSGFFFVDVRGTQVAEALQLLGVLNHGRRHDLLRDPSDINVEVLTSNPVQGEKLVHAVRDIELPKSPLENQPIKSLQDTGDERSKAL